ncbi:hypothetical protein ACFSTC_57150 [Nonomuraea ferruginea]
MVSSSSEIGWAARSATTRGRGTMISSAVWSPNSRARSSSSDRRGGSSPASVDSSMIRESSSGVAPCSTSSTGSMPTFLSSPVAAESNSRITGPTTAR